MAPSSCFFFPPVCDIGLFPGVVRFASTIWFRKVDAYAENNIALVYLPTSLSNYPCVGKHGNAHKRPISDFALPTPTSSRSGEDSLPASRLYPCPVKNVRLVRHAPLIILRCARWPQPRNRRQGQKKRDMRGITMPISFSSIGSSMESLRNALRVSFFVGVVYTSSSPLFYM